MGVMFLNRLQLARQVRITNLIGVKVGHAHPHTVFHFQGAKIMQEWSPLLVFFTIFSAMSSPVGIFKIRLAASAFWNCSDKRTIPLSSSTLACCSLTESFE